MQITDLVYIDSTGFHFADYPSFLTWLQDQYRGIYGADVYLESDSQDGQFIAVLAKSYYDLASLGASTFNSFSPSTAQGVGLARDVKINGIRKRSATNSTVDVLIVGQSGKTINNGIVQDTLNQKWNLPSLVTIPGGGSITVTATSQVIGAITADINTVNKIYTPTLGWQTVNNVAAATPGIAVETDAELRIRQTQSTANPSLTVFDGTVGAVENVSGVTKAKGYENATNSTDGNGLPPHSISVVVNGGSSTDIANVIALHKTPGTQTYGTTPITVYDSRGVPLVINFYRPAVASIKANITVAHLAGWSSDFVPLIQQAIADQINAGGIGDTVLITKIYTPAYLTGTPAGDTFDIVSLELEKGSGGFAAANITLLFNENPVCVAATDVAVTVT